MRDLIAAVDVGTGSARAGIFDRAGHLLGRADCPIAMNRPADTVAEHDSEDIWSAAGTAVKGAIAQAGASSGDIVAIGFDATCSLVVRDRQGQPLSVNAEGHARWDTIVWLDHRALAEADFCTATGHAVLNHCGGVMSPEMQMPKLMWLKRNLPERWEKVGHVFDLADFLSWRATGVAARSRCTSTAKWNYLAHENPGWQAGFLQTIGLSDLRERGSLPEETLAVGRSVGFLTPAAARDLGLETGCVVAAGLIDAYAGALGVLGPFAAQPDRLERQMALIAGTSSCIVAFSCEQKPARGLWGPYFEAVFPDRWLIEGGQSATGALLDHVVAMHSAVGAPSAAVHAEIISRIQQLRRQQGADFAARLHVLPDFHGNRSPLADPHALGVISGLTLDASFDSLCRLYWRTCVAIAFGIRHVLETMKASGYGLDALHVTGGHIRNPLLMELYSDVIGCPVIVPKTPDAMLLGTAMAAAVAGRLYPDLAVAGTGMYQGGEERRPDPATAVVHERDYRRFLALQRHRRELDALV